MVKTPDLAAIAVELSRAIDDIELARCAFALELEALVAGKNRSKLEILALRIGLSADATDEVLDKWERRARLMREASTVIRGLIEAETIAEAA